LSDHGISQVTAALSWPSRQASPLCKRAPRRVELESVACLHCGGNDQETVVITHDRLTSSGGNFRIVRCRYCGLSFTNPRPIPSDLALFYPADYAPHLEPPPAIGTLARWRRKLEHAVLRHRYGYPFARLDGKTRLLSLLGRAVVRRRRDRQHWIPFRAPGRLLDFGCGADDFLDQMRDYGWQVEGLDLFPEVIELVRCKPGVRAHLGSLPHPDIKLGTFDAITMRHSLEHVPFPKDVLQAAADALRSGGVLVVGVPNFDSWSFQHFQHNWTGLALPRHLTHFTPTTLCRMAEAVGFRTLKLEQIGRDGRIRKSARIATAAGQPSLLRKKLIAGLVARWTELTGRADSLRLVAEKI
jgi:2-polyprenyl-3-methyl-5-hydroxy-6-metoxy-1,4-benzoquinol methylase